MRTEHVRRVEAETGSTPRVRGRVLALVAAGSSTIATVRLEDGSGRDVVFRSAPDRALARRLSAGMRRASWVRIDATGAEPRCELFGTTRRPLRVPLPLPAALGMAEAGAPAIVRLPPAGTGGG